MFNRQFSLLVVATLLLSPSLVHANELDTDTNISVGNIRVQTNSRGTSIQTPGVNVNTGAADGDRIETSGSGISIQTPRIQIKTAKPTIDQTYLSRSRRRYRTRIKRGRIIYSPSIRRAPIEPDATMSNSSTIYQGNNGNIGQSTIRSSSSSSSQTINGQSRQSVQCQGSGSSSVSQSSQTINGRTVSSTVYRNCQ